VEHANQQKARCLFGARVSDADGTRPVPERQQRGRDGGGGAAFASDCVILLSSDWLLVVDLLTCSKVGFLRGE
jgi:hypothetical protein